MAEELIREKLNTRFEKAKRRKRFQMRLIDNWWVIATLIISFYAAMPIAAPVLMKAGITGPANTIYSAYSFTCHQFAFRSVFLFGDQTFYPRESTGTGLESFESKAARSDDFIALYRQQRGIDNTVALTSEQVEADLLAWSSDLQLAARDFKGDEDFGYKIAICQRDISIYVVMAIAGFIFGLVRKRLRPVPIWLYLLLGVAPIALDGFSQLLGYPPFELWEPRETMPLFRILTGGLFGLMNIWLAYPYIHSSMQESVNQLKRQIEAADVRIEEMLAKAKLGSEELE